MDHEQLDDAASADEHEDSGRLSRRGFLGASATLTVGALGACARPSSTPTATPGPDASSTGDAASEPEPEPVPEPDAVPRVAMLGTLAVGSAIDEGGERLRPLPELVSSEGRLDVALVAKMRDMTIGSHQVRLRAYDLGSEQGPYGPTLRIKNHTSTTRHLRIDLENALPQEEPQCPNHHEPNIFNDTNMHTHGLHVSPHEDDIFRRVKPTYSSRYAYVLDDHPGGTHWYHPHVHGSTGMQVASGMSGFLIVEGAVERLPELQGMRERLLLFNQLIYDTRTGPPHVLPNFAFLSDRDTQPPQGVTINGQVRPVIEMRSGEVQRWRLVNSGFRNAMRFSVASPVVMFRFAVDGINFEVPQPTPYVAMGPGNRMDLFVRAPVNRGPDPIDVPLQPREYNALYEYRGFLGASGQAALAELERSDPPPSGPPLAIIRVLPEPARHTTMPRRRLPLHPLWRNIEDREVVGETRPIEFDVDGRRFLINDKTFHMYEVPHRLRLGTAERWQLSNKVGQHPFHIHVNPFQVTHVGGHALERRMWKDTIIVPGRSEKPRIEPTATILSRYTQHTGDFVLHCHILHHEDLGMMHRVRIDA